MRIVILTDSRNMLKRKIGFGLISLSLVFALAGCFGSNETPDPVESETVVVKTLINPTVKGAESPIASTVLDGNRIDVVFLGAGYPTLDEIKAVNPEDPTTLPEGVSLIENKRAVALSFKFTNSSGQPFPIDSFQFGEAKVGGVVVPAVVNDFSLYSMLGASSYPSAVGKLNSSLETGETGVWSVDVLVPEENIGKPNIGISQTVQINANASTTINLTVNLTEK